MLIQLLQKIDEFENLPAIEGTIKAVAAGLMSAQESGFVKFPWQDYVTEDQVATVLRRIVDATCEKLLTLAVFDKQGL